MLSNQFWNVVFMINNIYNVQRIASLQNHVLHVFLLHTHKGWDCKDPKIVLFTD